MDKSCGRLNKEVSATLQQEVRSSKVGGYELVLCTAEHLSRGSVPTITKPIWESIGKLYNPTPFNLWLEEAWQR